MYMKIIKRDGTIQTFDSEKMIQAMKKAFVTDVPMDQLKQIAMEITQEIQGSAKVSVEDIQDLVEQKLMAYQFYNEAKAYILYREKRKEKRQMLLELCHEVQDEKLLPIFMQIQKDFDETYDLHALYIKFHSFLKETMGHEERLQMLMKACVELISKETPKWEYIAARFFELPTTSGN